MDNSQTQTSQMLRRNFLGSIRDALALLLEDIELTEKGFTYYHIVDFAAIYAYLYKTSDHLFIPIPGESGEQTFARMQMALKTLFTSRSHRLILIPPYMEELNSHLRTLETNAALAASGIEAFYREPENKSPYRNRLNRLIADSAAFREYLEVRDRQPQKTVSEQLQQAAKKLAKDYFPELYASLAFAAAREGREVLRTLFRDRVLLNSDEEIPECAEIEYTGEKTDEWYKKIRTMRSESRAVPSYTDAMACTYVETANQFLNSKKKIVVFVAPSRSVETTLRDQKMVCADDQIGRGVVRDLTYCLLSFIQGNNKEKIRENLETVRRLHDIYDSPIPVQWRTKRDDATRQWNRCENLLLITDPSMTEVSKIKSESDVDKALLDVLHQLHRAAQNKESITREVENTLLKLHDDAVQLNKLVPAPRTLETFRNLQVGDLGGRGMYLIFPALQGELPFPISFTDKSVRNLARNFRELNKESPPDSVMKLRTLILDKAGTPEARPENHLLAGYILALERRYETALAELGAGLKNATHTELRELLFMCAAIHRKAYHAREADDYIQKARTIDKDDLRLNIEYAKVLWLKWRDQPNRQASAQYLDEALEHLSNASKNPKTDLTKVMKAHIENGSIFIHKMLRAQIENVSAYLHTERALNFTEGSAAHLAQAADHIRALEQLLPPEKEWIGRFFDTRAYYQYAKARGIGPDCQGDKKAILEAGAQDADRSLTVDDEEDTDLEVRREHKRAIEQALAEIEVVQSQS